MMTVSIARPAFVPRSFALFQNIPNPFNATTRIDFNLPDAGDVTLIVYDVLGRKVATLVNDHLEPGAHHIEWDARDDGGRQLASGVYFYRIRTTSSQASRKMVLLK
jgi:flagellar hook assembly protein FlgD